MSLDHIKLSQQAKDQLSRLKRWTGLQHWNELCRWAFCISLSEASPPAPAKIPADSSVEMTWKVFAGQHAPVYLALLRHRCAMDGVPDDEESMSEYLRLHLHRGIAYLAGDRNIRSIAALLRRIPAMGASDARAATDPDSAAQDSSLAD